MRRGECCQDHHVRLLHIEDEIGMATALRAAMQAHDMIVDHASTLADAEEAVRMNAYAVILLDRQLPDGDGLSFIPRIRALSIMTPVIVLTARSDLPDRIAGLDRGADDYLGKPFAVEELLARLRAILRRPAEVSQEIISLGRLCFDVGNREVRVGDAPLDLPRRELLVLETLLGRSGRTVLRSSLEEAVYGMDDEIQSNALDAHVSRLRKKLAEVDSGLEIHAMRGIGYLLKPSAR